MTYLTENLRGNVFRHGWVSLALSFAFFSGDFILKLSPNGDGEAQRCFLAIWDLELMS